MSVEDAKNISGDRDKFTIEQGIYQPQATGTTPKLRRITLSLIVRLNPLGGKTNTTWDTAPSEIIR